MWGMAEIASFVMFQVSRDFAAMSYIEIVIIAETRALVLRCKKSIEVLQLCDFVM
jgi:hypothetical protein